MEQVPSLLICEYLIECERKEDAETLVEQGFDIEEVHVSVHPPQGKYVNVSIMGLRSYIDDQDVKDALSLNGEIKSEVVRLKYKADHKLAGLQNGNRLVKMVLEKQSIPYSLRIGGEWCKIIHNNQQPVCSECSEVGHTRKRSRQWNAESVTNWETCPIIATGKTCLCSRMMKKKTSTTEKRALWWIKLPWHATLKSPAAILRKIDKTAFRSKWILSKRDSNVSTTQTRTLTAEFLVVGHESIQRLTHTFHVERK